MLGKDGILLDGYFVELYVIYIIFIFYVEIMIEDKRIFG